MHLHLTLSLAKPSCVRACGVGLYCNGHCVARQRQQQHHERWRQWKQWQQRPQQHSSGAAPALRRSVLSTANLPATVNPVFWPSTPQPPTPHIRRRPSLYVLYRPPLVRTEALPPDWSILRNLAGAWLIALKVFPQRLHQGPR
ncbi:hypothetical protein DFJ73DRAFT_140718 [Zopfochytrium polystomum]|nr:hypothetical protein DFJ73DRAFT_140718 [Zopfochytrium polystomum]